MKKISVFLLSFLIFLASCAEKEQGCPYQTPTTVAPEAEVAIIEQYLSSKNITDATKHPSGFYYKITAPGSGASTPTTCSQIGINYKGMLANGTIFDQTTTDIRVFVLGQLIAGWQLGIPLIKSGGGKITLYIPPTLGYGDKAVRDQQGNVLIPASSMLIFDVELVAVG